MAMTKADRTWIEKHFNGLRELIVTNQVDIAVLKFKAGVWGIIGGAIPVLITIAIYLIYRGTGS